MATTIPTTLAELLVEVQQRIHSGTGTTAADVITRHLNAGLHDFNLNYNWPWMERRAVLNTHEPYSTGTVAIALSARTTVTGTDTLWNTAVTGMGFNNARALGKMRFNGENDVYTVTTVTNDTSITLTDRYVGTEALSADTYEYYEDEYALASDFLRLVDAREFTDAWNIPVIPRREFYQRFPRNYKQGRPSVCTILELGPTSSSTTLQPRVLFSPAPDAIYQIPYRYITDRVAVSSDGTTRTSLGAGATTDEPVMPLRFRMALVHYAVYSWYRDRSDDARAALAYEEYMTIVKRAQADMRPEGDKLRLIPRRRSHGYKRFGTSGFSTNTDFDSMRE